MCALTAVCCPARLCADHSDIPFSRLILCAAMATFDSWLDYSVGLFTTRLDDYLTRLLSSHVPIFAARWPAQSDASVPVMFYSAFIHVPDSQARFKS